MLHQQHKPAPCAAKEDKPYRVKKEEVHPDKYRRHAVNQKKCVPRGSGKTLERGAPARKPPLGIKTGRHYTDEYPFKAES